MFFNTKKYAQEAEKNRQANLWQEPSMFNMLSLAFLASFALTRPLLRLHPQHVQDLTTQEPSKVRHEQVPIIYFHGFRGGDYTTKIMVEQGLKDKGKNDFLKVTVDLWGNFRLEGTWTNDLHPMVQVVFRQRIVGIYTIDYYLSLLLPFLAKRYNFNRYTAVAHSLSCPCIIRSEIKHSRNKKFPHLDKCALVAGPFNGVTYLGDIPNVNRLNEKGRPNLMNAHYLYLLWHRKRFNPNISVLNIYGNILDQTNTDRFISVVSAKSIRYILAPIAHRYQEVEIRGEKYAEHSIMHDNPFVIDIINKFVGLKDY